MTEKVLTKICETCPKKRNLCRLEDPMMCRTYRSTIKSIDTMSQVNALDDYNVRKYGGRRYKT